MAAWQPLTTVHCTDAMAHHTPHPHVQVYALLMRVPGVGINKENNAGEGTVGLVVISAMLSCRQLKR